MLDPDHFRARIRNVFNKNGEAHASAETLTLPHDDQRSHLLDRESRDLCRDGTGVGRANAKDEDEVSDDSVERLVYGNDYVERRQMEREQAKQEEAKAWELRQEMDAMLKA